MGARADRAGLRDRVAGTGLERLLESGVRRLMRGAIRRGVTDFRWVAAGLGGLIVLGGLLFGGLRLSDGLRAREAQLQAAVDAVTQEAVKGAILEYDRLEEHATFRLDARLLGPRATDEWVARKRGEFEEMRQSGLRQDSRLVEATFRDFRWVDDNRIEADVVEVWQTTVYDGQGRPVREIPAHEVPQTAIVVREGDRWKIGGVRFHEDRQVSS